MPGSRSLTYRRRAALAASAGGTVSDRMVMARRLGGAAGDEPIQDEEEDRAQDRHHEADRIAGLVPPQRAPEVAAQDRAQNAENDRDDEATRIPAGDDELMREVYTGPDFAEGVRAFLAKEKPAFG